MVFADLLLRVVQGSSGQLSATTNVYISIITLVLFYKALMIKSLLNPIWYIQKRLHAWAYLLNAPQIIQEEYDKADGKPFEVYAPDQRYVFVSDPKQIKELDSAAEDVLSLRAASKGMLQPVYTMKNFNWFDARSIEGYGLVRAIRTLLTNHTPALLPELGSINRTRFAELLAENPIVDGVRHSPVYPMVSQLVVLNHATAFFGKELAQKEDFLKSALGFIEETIICAEVLRLLPKFMVPLVGNIISTRLKAGKKFFDYLIPVCDQRIRERDVATMGRPAPKHSDCIQFVLETSPKEPRWNAKRVVQELLAIWFGSNHALSTTLSFAIHDLCTHPEYVAPLRAELNAGYASFERTGNGLPLLDSFMKESARLSPAESMSTRRQALHPFTLSDGTYIRAGEWACTPVRSMMRDRKNYPQPEQFSGFRFASREVVAAAAVGDFGKGVAQERPSKLTDLSASYNIWGTGKMACPGRFYATAVMKLIVGQIIMGYDCALADPEKKRSVTWRSYMLPTRDSMVVFTPLKEEE